MRRIAPLLLWLAVAANAPAAGEIVGPETVPLFTLATVHTDVDAESFIWLVFPFETTSQADQADPKVLGAKAVVDDPQADRPPVVPALANLPKRVTWKPPESIA